MAAVTYPHARCAKPAPQSNIKHKTMFKTDVLLAAG